MGDRHTDSQNEGEPAPQHESSRALVVRDVPFTPLLTILAAQLCCDGERATARCSQAWRAYHANSPDLAGASVDCQE